MLNIEQTDRKLLQLHCSQTDPKVMWLAGSYKSGGLSNEHYEPITDRADILTVFLLTFGFGPISGFVNKWP